MRAAAATLRQLPRVALSLPPRIRRRLAVALLAALVLFSVYRFWFRDSGFVAVHDVTVTGLTTKDAPRIRSALIAAAHDMTTLDVQQGALNAAVSGFPVVKAVEATPSFPHGLKIRVIEERPLAVLDVAGERLALAADGTVLRSVPAGQPLAVIRSAGSPPGTKLSDPGAVAALHVLAAAPGPLARRATGVRHDPSHGLVVTLRSGPQLYFGDDSQLDAKWAAVAAVLADPTSKGASYIDVRLPGRAVAGGLATSTLTPLTTNGQDATTSVGTTGTTGPSGQTPSSP